ncbi:hypothetical protein BC828DRAFT_440877 [Blastocladiella britannica]|nr:hypothetical protein BC828DRAFT_440877 [Blastocladiella britannica]
MSKALKRLSETMRRATGRKSSADRERERERSNGTGSPGSNTGNTGSKGSTAPHDPSPLRAPDYTAARRAGSASSATDSAASSSRSIDTDHDDDDEMLPLGITRPVPQHRPRFISVDLGAPTLFDDADEVDHDDGLQHASSSSARDFGDLAARAAAASAADSATSSAMATSTTARALPPTPGDMATAFASPLPPSLLPSPMTTSPTVLRSLSGSSAYSGPTPVIPSATPPPPMPVLGPKAPLSVPTLSRSQSPSPASVAPLLPPTISTTALPSSPSSALSPSTTPVRPSPLSMQIRPMSVATDLLGDVAAVSLALVTALETQGEHYNNLPRGSSSSVSSPWQQQVQGQQQQPAGPLVPMSRSSSIKSMSRSHTILDDHDDDLASLIAASALSALPQLRDGGPVYMLRETPPPLPSPTPPPPPPLLPALDTKPLPSPATLARAPSSASASVLMTRPRTPSPIDGAGDFGTPLSRSPSVVSSTSRAAAAQFGADLVRSASVASAAAAMPPMPSLSVPSTLARSVSNTSTGPSPAETVVSPPTRPLSPLPQPTLPMPPMAVPQQPAATGMPPRPMTPIAPPSLVAAMQPAAPLPVPRVASPSAQSHILPLHPDALPLDAQATARRVLAEYAFNVAYVADWMNGDVSPPTDGLTDPVAEAAAVAAAAKKEAKSKRSTMRNLLSRTRHISSRSPAVVDDAETSVRSPSFANVAMHPPLRVGPLAQFVLDLFQWEVYEDYQPMDVRMMFLHLKTFLESLTTLSSMVGSSSTATLASTQAPQFLLPEHFPTTEHFQMRMQHIIRMMRGEMRLLAEAHPALMQLSMGVVSSNGRLLANMTGGAASEEASETSSMHLRDWIRVLVPDNPYPMLEQLLLELPVQPMSADDQLPMDRRSKALLDRVCQLWRISPVTKEALLAQWVASALQSTSHLAANLWPALAIRLDKLQLTVRRERGTLGTGDAALVRQVLAASVRHAKWYVGSASDDALADLPHIINVMRFVEEISELLGQPSNCAVLESFAHGYTRRLLGLGAGGDHGGGPMTTPSSAAAAAARVSASPVDMMARLNHGAEQLRYMVDALALPDLPRNQLAFLLAHSFLMSASEICPLRLPNKEVREELTAVCHQYRRMRGVEEIMERAREYLLNYGLDDLDQRRYSMTPDQLLHLEYLHDMQVLLVNEKPEIEFIWEDWLIQLEDDLCDEVEHQIEEHLGLGNAMLISGGGSGSAVGASGSGADSALALQSGSSTPHHMGRPLSTLSSASSFDMNDPAGGDRRRAAGDPATSMSMLLELLVKYLKYVEGFPFPSGHHVVRMVKALTRIFTRAITHAAQIAYRHILDSPLDRAGINRGTLVTRIRQLQAARAELAGVQRACSLALASLDLDGYAAPFAGDEVMTRLEIANKPLGTVLEVRADGELLLSSDPLVARDAVAVPITREQTLELRLFASADSAAAAAVLGVAPVPSTDLSCTIPVSLHQADNWEPILVFEGTECPITLRVFRDESNYVNVYFTGCWDRINETIDSLMVVIADKVAQHILAIAKNFKKFLKEQSHPGFLQQLQQSAPAAQVSSLFGSVKSTLARHQSTSPAAGAPTTAAASQGLRRDEAAATTRYRLAKLDELNQYLSAVTRLLAALDGRRAGDTNAAAAAANRASAPPPNSVADQLRDAAWQTLSSRMAQHVLRNKAGTALKERPLEYIHWLQTVLTRAHDALFDSPSDAAVAEPQSYLMVLLSRYGVQTDELQQEYLSNIMAYLDFKSQHRDAQQQQQEMLPPMPYDGRFDAVPTGMVAARALGGAAIPPPRSAARPAKLDPLLARITSNRQSVLFDQNLFRQQQSAAAAAAGRSGGAQASTTLRRRIDGAAATPSSRVLQRTPRRAPSNAGSFASRARPMSVLARPTTMYSMAAPSTAAGHRRPPSLGSKVGSIAPSDPMHYPLFAVLSILRVRAETDEDIRTWLDEQKAVEQTIMQSMMAEDEAASQVAHNGSVMGGGHHPVPFTSPTSMPRSVPSPAHMDAREMVLGKDTIMVEAVTRPRRPRFQ